MFGIGDRHFLFLKSLAANLVLKSKPEFIRFGDDDPFALNDTSNTRTPIG
jgi:hypothetical protein